MSRWRTFVIWKQSIMKTKRLYSCLICVSVKLCANIVLWLLVWTYLWKVCLILQCRCIVVHEYIFAHLLCVHMSLWMRVKPCNSFIFWLQAQEKNRRTLLKQTNTQAGTVGAMKLDAESAYCPLFLDFPPITLLLILEFWAHYFRLMFN